VAHRALPDGRVTLREHLLVEERDGKRSERILQGRDEWLALLRERFGIVL
jgi:arylamine N-acetyltransferase